MTVSEVERNHLDLNKLSPKEFKSFVRNYDQKERGQAIRTFHQIEKVVYETGKI